MFVRRRDYSNLELQLELLCLVKRLFFLFFAIFKKTVSSNAPFRAVLEGDLFSVFFTWLTIFIHCVPWKRRSFYFPYCFLASASQRVRPKWVPRISRTIPFSFGWQPFGHLRPEWSNSYFPRFRRLDNLALFWSENIASQNRPEIDYKGKNLNLNDKIIKNT